MQVGERGVDRLEVALHDLRAALLVGLFDRVLDLGNCLFGWQDTGNREEAGLHDRVDSTPHAGLACDLGRVDHVKADALLEQLCLNLTRQVIPDLAGRIRRIEQEDRLLPGMFEHVDPLQELELMARDEAGLGDQISRPDRTRTRAQMRNGRCARLLGVVDEVPLDEQVGRFSDDLDRVLVGANRAIGAKAVENRRCDVARLDVVGVVTGQRRVRHIVHDADGKVIPRVDVGQRVEDRSHHGRCELLRRETVAAAYHDRLCRERGHPARARLGQGRDHILIQRLAECARFLRAVHHRDRPNRSR